MFPSAQRQRIDKGLLFCTIGLILGLSACSTATPTVSDHTPHPEDHDDHSACSTVLAQADPPEDLQDRPAPAQEPPVSFVDEQSKSTKTLLWNVPDEATAEALLGSTTFLDDSVQAGRRKFRVINARGEGPIPQAPGVIKYRVMVEHGLETEADIFNQTVGEVLGHPQGWIRAGYVFVQVSEDEDLSVVLANPATIDTLCYPMPTGGHLSCAAYKRANLNVMRWRRGSHTWGDDVTGYRSYLVNHEVGHLLGMRHLSCPTKGQAAPIMLPQTKYLKGCTPNGHPTQEDLTRMEAVKAYKQKLAKKSKRGR